MTKRKITLIAALMTAASAAACGPATNPATMSPAFLHRLNHVCIGLTTRS